MCCWVRCDVCPGAEWTLHADLLRYMFERMGKWEVAFLDWRFSKAKEQYKSITVPMWCHRQLLTGSCPWYLNTAVCGAGQRDRVAWYSLDHTAEVLVSKPTGFFWTGCWGILLKPRHIYLHIDFQKPFFATCQDKNHCQNILSVHPVRCLGWWRIKSLHLAPG